MLQLSILTSKNTRKLIKNTKKTDVKIKVLNENKFKSKIQKYKRPVNEINPTKLLIVVCIFLPRLTSKYHKNTILHPVRNYL